MMSELLETNTNEEGQIRDEYALKSVVAVSYAGGSDTIVSSLLSFYLAMVLFPEVQKRAQEEIDCVIGKGRLPTSEDRDSMPYMEGIMRELQRWNPVVPLTPPHRLMTDDVYEGYFIPAGCDLIANQWAMLHDEKEYPEPFAFKPERWLLKEGQPEPLHPNKVAFGFGRRLCPGRHLADQAIFIVVTSVLATFNISPSLDINGKPIIPTGEYLSGLISHPEPFECTIMPRSPEAAALIRQTMENLTVK